MTTYIMDMHEVWIQRFKVEAESLDEAIEKFADGEGETDGDPEYSHTLEDKTVVSPL